MPEYLSSDDVRRRNRETMGAELGDLYTVLCNDLTWLFWRWDQYVQLFAERPSRLEIVNNSAPFFFFVVQRTLWYDTLLGLTSLTSPEKSAGKDNLTIRRILNFVTDPSLRAELSLLVDKAVDVTAFARDWRNREIAHRDLALSLGRQAEPLATATRELVQNALAAIAAVLNRVDLHFMDSTHHYGSPTGERGAVDLLHVIRSGLLRAKQREDRLQTGAYVADEWPEDHDSV